jgi:D-sedoheptulose 7-phosphate isomerase
MNTNWIESFFEAEVAQHKQAVLAVEEALCAPFAEMVAACAGSIRGGGKIMFFGNGGSASDAQHLATELSIRYIADRAPIAAIALNTDTSALTAAGNDLGFEQIFARQVEALARKGDVVIGISTSGTSPNVVAGLHMARAKGCKTVGLTSEKGLSMAEHVDVLLPVPAKATARIQEMHILLGHMLCGALEQELGLAPRAGGAA